MRANDMKDQFQLQYDGAKLGNRTFNDREVADFLNKAQLQIIKQRFDALKNRTQRGLGDTEIRGAEIEGLVATTSLITRDQFIQGTRYNGASRNTNRSLNLYSGFNQEDVLFGVYAPLPDECLYILSQTCTTSNTEPQAGVSVYIKDNVPMKEVNYGEYDANIYDFYSKPYDNLVWAMGYGNWTPSEFDSATGKFVPSTKDYNPDEATVAGKGYNIIGYSPVALDLSALGSIVENRWYVVVGTGATTPGTDTITYNGVEYEVGDTFLGTAVTDFTINGNNVAVRNGNMINTRRSKYLLPGVSERGRVVGEVWHVTEYRVHYLKTPDPIFIDTVTPALQVDCQLADFMHQEVVDLAVKIASAAIVPEQGKYNVNQNEAVINE